MESSGISRPVVSLRSPANLGVNLRMAPAWARINVSLIANSSLRKIRAPGIGGSRWLSGHAAHMVKHACSRSRRDNSSYRGVDHGIEKRKPDQLRARFAVTQHGA